MRKIQSRDRVVPASLKVVQEASFATKVDKVVTALSISKPLCKSIIESGEFLARVAADPTTELSKKRRNMRYNGTKNKILLEAKQRKKVTRQQKCKGKRPAGADPEPDSPSTGGSEMSEAVRSSPVAA
jgi:hypothetical protein